MKNIILASTNTGKLAEFNEMLGPLGFTLQSQASLGIEAIPETGLTFVENAILKARHACLESKTASLADDSGLIVPALNGAPGLCSARFAGEQASATDNINKLLRALQGEANRVAYFYCVIVLLQQANDPMPLVCQGRFDGEILTAPRGDAGFGYDPIFYVPSVGLSASELSPQHKNTLSHRGQAIQQLLHALSS